MLPQNRRNVTQLLPLWLTWTSDCVLIICTRHPKPTPNSMSVGLWVKEVVKNWCVFILTSEFFWNKQGYWKWCPRSRQISPSVGTPAWQWWCQRSNLPERWAGFNTRLWVCTVKCAVGWHARITSDAVAPGQKSEAQHGVTETEHHAQHVQDTDHLGGGCADQHGADHEAQHCKHLEQAHKPDSTFHHGWMIAWRGHNTDVCLNISKKKPIKHPLIMKVFLRDDILGDSRWRWSRRQ